MWTLCKLLVVYGNQKLFLCSVVCGMLRPMPLILAEYPTLIKYLPPLCNQYASMRLIIKWQSGILPKWEAEVEAWLGTKTNKTKDPSPLLKGHRQPSESSTVAWLEMSIAGTVDFFQKVNQEDIYQIVSILIYENRSKKEFPALFKFVLAETKLASTVWILALMAINICQTVSPCKFSERAAVKSPRSLPRLNVGITSTRNPSGQ